MDKVQNPSKYLIILDFDDADAIITDVELV
jgi:hypothetical protein